MPLGPSQAAEVLGVAVCPATPPATPLGMTALWAGSCRLSLPMSVNMDCICSDTSSWGGDITLLRLHEGVRWESG